MICTFVLGRSGIMLIRFYQDLVRDAVIKENPVNSGFLQIGGGWGVATMTELKVFEHSFC